MALMRFRSKPRQRSLFARIGADNRRPEHLGDAPPVSPAPEHSAWSLTSYPYPAPDRRPADDDVPPDENNRQES